MKTIMYVLVERYDPVQGEYQLFFKWAYTAGLSVAQGSALCFHTMV